MTDKNLGEVNVGLFKVPSGRDRNCNSENCSSNASPQAPRWGFMVIYVLEPGHALVGSDHRRHIRKDELNRGLVSVMGAASSHLPVG